MRLVAVLCALIFGFSLSSRADLTYPASFEIIEEQPDQFRLTLTVPLVKGRYLKLNPRVPHGFLEQGEPQFSAGEASLTQSWRANPPPGSLHSAPFGLEGLLGTAHEVRFLLTTLDGRRLERVLRPAQSIFIVPQPKPAMQMVADFGRQGLRRSARSFGLWVLSAALIFSGLTKQKRRGGLLMTVIGFSLFWMITAPTLSPELSDRSTRLATAILIAGHLAGAAGIVTALALLRSLFNPPMRSLFFSAAWTLAAAWILYQGAGLFYHYGIDWADQTQRFCIHLGHQWFSPFASDWAMAKLRIPLGSIVALIACAWALKKIRHQRIKVAVSAGLLVLGFILLPYGTARASIPFKKPATPSAKQAHRIIGPMLSNIYAALNLEDEEQTYDELAGQVSQSLITDLYLDSRRRLISGLREGASVTVKQVVLESVEPAPSGSDVHTYQCKWVVTAKVTHWQHTHERRNLYEGELSLTVEGDAWKLAALTLQSEEREIVRGSFSSR